LIQIAIGTKNPTKVKAIQEVFGHDVNYTALSVESNVSSQPFSDEETIEGAINRAKHSLTQAKADIGIGLEGGVVETKYGLMLCNWGALIYRNNTPIVAGGARILLPEVVAREVREGKELGEVMEDYSQKKDVRKSEGAIGIFTNGFVSRTEMFTHVVKLLAGQFEYQK